MFMEPRKAVLESNETPAVELEVTESLYDVPNI